MKQWFPLLKQEVGWWTVTWSKKDRTMYKIVQKTLSFESLAKAIRHMLKIPKGKIVNFNNRQMVGSAKIKFGRFYREKLAGKYGWNWCR